MVLVLVICFHLRGGDSVRCGEIVCGLPIVTIAVVGVSVIVILYAELICFLFPAVGCYDFVAWCWLLGLCSGLRELVY